VRLCIGVEVEWLCGERGWPWERGTGAVVKVGCVGFGGSGCVCEKADEEGEIAFIAPDARVPGSGTEGSARELRKEGLR
jgi:hypothetical protein